MVNIKDKKEDMKREKILAIASWIRRLWEEHKEDMTNAEMENVLLMLTIVDDMYVPERTELH